ncbi:T9SS type A sorting domain-containing protein, partial [Rubrivirga sp.]|uniref:T9SS type A sorting domain-containing protein n=1 Tax=Rubrivirga sp. TaxID=1885344 RepID=UPI003C73AE33
PGSDLFDGDPADDDELAPFFIPFETGTFTDGGFNLIGTNNTVEETFTAGEPNANDSYVGTGQGDAGTRVDPGISGSNRNETYAVTAVELGSGSVAINNGVNTDLEGNEIVADGRGFQRPGTADGDETVDIGAFEFDSEPVMSQLVINELDSVTAPSGEDDRAEFVEIRNTGDAPAQLADFALVLYSGEDDTAYASFDLEGELAPGETFVFGDPGVSNVDQDELSGTSDDIRDEDGAIGIYRGNASDYPVGAVAGQNASTRVDVLVYNNGTQSSRRARDANSLAAAFGQSEDDIASGDTDDTSLQRDESGDFSAGTPTPGGNTGSGGLAVSGFTLDDTTLAEGESTQLTATIGTTTNADVVIDLTYSNSSDLDGPDSITIPTGQTSASVTVTAVADGEAEGEEQVTIDIDSVSNASEGTEKSATVTIEPSEAALPTVSFADVQQAVNEGDGSVELGIELSDIPDTGELTVTLVSGDPADVGGFESETFDISDLEGAGGQYAVTIPITDDAISEDDETLVFELSVAEDPNGGDPTLEVGARAQTVVIIVDNDGDPVTSTVTIRDRDGDGLEDGGFRLLSLPIGGVTAGDLSDALNGADVLTFNDSTGTFTPFGDDDFIAPGQPVAVEVEPGTEITLDGSSFGGDVTFDVFTVTDSTDATDVRDRVLVSVGNPSDNPLPLSALSVDGGTLGSVALVLDDETGGFRPVVLSDLEDAVLPAFGAAIFQVVPDTDSTDVSVSAGFDDGDANADGDDLTDTPTDSDDVLTVSLTGDDGGDTIAVRFDGMGGLDLLDAVDVTSPGGVTLSALEGGLPLALLALTDDVDFGPTAARTVPLSVMVPMDGTYTFDIGGETVEVGGRTLDVELLDDGAPVAAGDDGTVEVSISGDTDDRFALRFTVQNAVASDESLGTELSIGNAYPNPTTGAATLEVAVAETETVRVVVFDVLGRQVAVAHNGTVAAGTALEVDLGAARLAPGSYVVRVEGESFTETRRLTVSR